MKPSNTRGLEIACLDSGVKTCLSRLLSRVSAWYHHWGRDWKNSGPIWLGGVSGAGPITRFDATRFYTRIAAEVKDFYPKDFIAPKAARRMDLFAQFAVASARMALDDALLNLDRTDRDRVAVVMGSGIGGLTNLEQQKDTWSSPFLIPMVIPNMAAGQIALTFGLRGPNYTTVSACASANNAIGESFKLLQRGQADVAVTGGSEAPIISYSISGFGAMRALSTRNHAPERASRPFDRERDGFVIGEGAVVLVLETLEHARRRGAEIYAEIGDYGCTCDAYHVSAPEQTGITAALAMGKWRHGSMMTMCYGC